MSSVRVRAIAQADGELHLRGLPIRKGQEADVIVLTDESTDDALLAVLQHDPAWAWILSPEEDVYTEADAR